jgi:hypothetical protein
MQMTKITITVPMLENPNRGYLSRYVGNIKITDGQAETLRRLQRGAVAADAILENGTHVQTVNQTLLWLLERVGEQYAGHEQSPVADLPGVDQIGA